MNRVCSIFSQILQLIPRLRPRSGNTGPSAMRGASAVGPKLIAMLFAQLGQAQSLGEITGGPAACEGKLRHLRVS